jgi:hypothetical protein
MPVHTLAKPSLGSANLLWVLRRIQIGGQSPLSANRLGGDQKPTFKFTLGKDYGNLQSHSCQLRTSQETWSQLRRAIVVTIEENEYTSTRACLKCCQFDSAL